MILQITHLENAKNATIEEAEVVRTKLSTIYDEIQNYTSNALVRLKQLVTNNFTELLFLFYTRYICRKGLQFFYQDVWKLKKLQPILEEEFILLRMIIHSTIALMAFIENILIINAENNCNNNGNNYEYDSDRFTEL